MNLVFAGGGTGGHLFPALAIREALPDASTIFLCSDRPLDSTILTREGVDFAPIKARPIIARPLALARLVYAWGGAVRAARHVIAELDRPIIVAMGGYVAAPVVQAARAEKAPVLLVNLDAVPGKANRWIAKRATRILTAAPVEQGWERIPPIVRASAVGGDREACRTTLGLEADRRTLLVCGGSQGARSINLFMAHFAGRHADALADWQIIHQCGDKDEADVRFAYESANVRAVVTPFIDPMGPAWGAADLAVSRAGAGSVGEAWANKTPTIFMPYPHHRDQHQRRNAEVLGDAGVIVQDRITPQANVAEAGARLLELMSDEQARLRAASMLDQLGPTNGAERVVDALRDLAR